MRKNSRKNQVFKLNSNKRKSIKAIKKRRKSQEKRKFRNQIKTEFYKIFGKDLTGLLFFFQTHG